ncbi:histidine kinase dimerization/phosphoacceptor domain -containing protein [Bradyrhizobium lupini]
MLDYLSTNALFAITAAGTALVAEFQRIELRRVMMADKTKALLLQQLAHRTKNNLAILGAMIRLKVRHGGPELARPLEATARRLQVMAEVYDHLSPKEDARSVNMRYFMNDVVEKSSSRWAHPRLWLFRCPARISRCRTARRLRSASSPTSSSPTR